MVSTVVIITILSVLSIFTAVIMYLFNVIINQIQLAIIGILIVLVIVAVAVFSVRRTYGDMSTERAETFMKDYIEKKNKKWNNMA